MLRIGGGYRKRRDMARGDMDVAGFQVQCDVSMINKKRGFFLVAALSAIAIAVVLTTNREQINEAILIDANGTPATAVTAVSGTAPDGGVGGVPPDGGIREIRIDPLSGSQKVREPATESGGGSPTNELACEDAGGTWNGCGSACRNEPDSKMCIQVCVEYCECTSSSQCPSEKDNSSRLTCTDFVDGTGVCK